MPDDCPAHAQSCAHCTGRPGRYCKPAQPLLWPTKSSLVSCSASQTPLSFAIGHSMAVHYTLLRTYRRKVCITGRPHLRVASSTPSLRHTTHRTRPDRRKIDNIIYSRGRRRNTLSQLCVGAWACPILWDARHHSLDCGKHLLMSSIVDPGGAAKRSMSIC